MIKMPIKYEKADDIEYRARDIARDLFPHIKLDRVHFVRSRGSKSRGTLARCYGLGKIWQKSLGIKSNYIVEIISERFDRLNDEDKIKTIIHELMHIPKCFGGGFKHHDYVNSSNINKLYNKYKNDKNEIQTSICRSTDFN